jgi:hypothetical protein
LGYDFFLLSFQFTCVLYDLFNWVFLVFSFLFGFVYVSIFFPSHVYAPSHIKKKIKTCLHHKITKYFSISASFIFFHLLNLVPFFFYGYLFWLWSLFRFFLYNFTLHRFVFLSYIFLLLSFFLQVYKIDMFFHDFII